MSNVAVILGAGNGTRMKCEQSKLLLKIKGKTVIERSVEAFLNISDIDEVIVVARQQDIDTFISLFPDERVSFAIGGETRQQSVYNAIQTIDDAELIKAEDIENTVRQAKEHKAAAVGVPVKDTIKIIDKDSFVVETPERSSLFAVQTPQIFDFKLYSEILEKAVSDGKDFTDDCQLAEYSGVKVKMVEGSYSNIKITTPDDIPVAESLLEKEEA